MSISDKFENFNNNIRISNENIDNISYRYKRITKQINRDFWDSDSETNHSLYVGSYGRDTEIHLSDIDMLFYLPYETYVQYNNYNGNGQSALLQSVKETIEKTYPITRLKADGQVVIVPFKDGIVFEVVPCFINKDDSYTYPDSNNGGSWKTTNPKPEIEEIRTKNLEWNYNLKRLCRMVRSWKDTCNVPLGGLLIDTFAYNFLYSWEHKDKSYVYYDWMIRDFFEYLKNQNEDQEYWLAPGSNQRVNRKGSFHYKAVQAYNSSIEAIDYENRDMEYSANLKWREIFGARF